MNANVLADDREAERLYLVDGATGATRWGRPADVGFAIGDITGDGVTEIGAAGFLLEVTEDEVVAGARHLAYDADGTALYDRSYTLRLPMRGADVVFILVGLGPAGDVHGDGIADLMHELFVVTFNCDADTGECVPVDEASVIRVVDGRTGDGQVETDVPVAPLFDSIDGDGDDLVGVVTQEGQGSVVALDGRTAATLWTFPLGTVGEGSFAFADPGSDVNGDGTTDVLVHVVDFDTNSMRRGVLDAATGELIWGL